MEQHTDIAIIGGGIAGASLAYWLAPHVDLIVIEREFQPGYHATGRSAAMFIESYGPPLARQLTAASGAFYRRPPAGFSEPPLLTPRGVLYVGRASDVETLAAHAASVAACTHCVRIPSGEIATRVPILGEDFRTVDAVFEPEAHDIDVHALHHGYLRSMRRAGGQLCCDFNVTAITRRNSRWLIESRSGRISARILVNAAGAWCDEIAALSGVPPIGLQPKRRSAFTFAAPTAVECKQWPAVVAADESFYFKPDASQILGSPANADPDRPHDVQAEELDIAQGIHAIETATTLRIHRPTRIWAGLRTFAADGDLVGGFDPGQPSFFWLAGQGGFGIQSSAAMGRACAALIRGQPIPDDLHDAGITAAALSPARFSVP